MHHPSADLIVIAGLNASESTYHTVESILWLLSNRFKGTLSPPEILGREFAGARASHQGDQQLLLSVEQLKDVSRKSGVVLCLPRLRLQRWLVTEGRSWRRDDSWSPEWMDDEAGEPPALPVRRGSLGDSRGGLDGTSGASMTPLSSSHPHESVV